jgi:hypothetical protein
MDHTHRLGFGKERSGLVSRRGDRTEQTVAFWLYILCQMSDDVL